MNCDKVIQGLWIGSRLSLMEQLSITSFIKHGHEYHLYVYEDVEDVPQHTVLKSADEIISREHIFKYSGKYAVFADLFRYKLLLERGGYWVDTDVVCLRPFNFNSDYVFGQEKALNGSKVINNGVIKAPVGSAFMQFCYDANRLKDPNNLVWGEIGPQLIAEAVKKFKLLDYVLPYETFYPIHWWDWRDLISKKMSVRIKTKLKLMKKVYAVHLWNEMWRREKVDKESVYSPVCVYEKLKRMYLGAQFQLT